MINEKLLPLLGDCVRRFKIWTIIGHDRGYRYGRVARCRRVTVVLDHRKGAGPKPRAGPCGATARTKLRRVAAIHYRNRSSLDIKLA